MKKRCGKGRTRPGSIPVDCTSRSAYISIAKEGERLIDRRIYDISIKEFGKDREMSI